MNNVDPMNNEDPTNNIDSMNNDPMPPQDGGQGMSVAGMVLGIVSVVCCGLIGIICGVVGVILSGLALKDNKPGRGMAIAGVACSIVGIVGGIIYLTFYAATFLPYFNFRTY